MWTPRFQFRSLELSKIWTGAQRFLLTAICWVTAPQITFALTDSELNCGSSLAPPLFSAFNRPLILWKVGDMSIVTPDSITTVHADEPKRYSQLNFNTLPVSKPAAYNLRHKRTGETLSVHPLDGLPNSPFALLPVGIRGKTTVEISFSEGDLQAQSRLHEKVLKELNSRILFASVGLKNLLEARKQFHLSVSGADQLTHSTLKGHRPNKLHLTVKETAVIQKMVCACSQASVFRKSLRTLERDLQRLQLPFFDDKMEEMNALTFQTLKRESADSCRQII